MFHSSASAWIAGLCLVPQVFSQTPAKVDFARDVQPIFRQNCIGCHGPNKQNNGLRVDRRSSVLKPGSRRVQPGSSENSFLLHRLTGSEYGMQMPPTGPLRPEQIQIIKTWIDQGAEWPDSLANENELPPLDPKAIAMVETLRAADRQAFNKMLAADPKLLNARGPEGSTPFMYAVLYSDAPTLDRLLKLGADPNKRNDAGATALMWAALDLEKTRVLVAHGADVNAKSDDARTPLMMAAGRPGGRADRETAAGPRRQSQSHVESRRGIVAAARSRRSPAIPTVMQALLDQGRRVQRHCRSSPSPMRRQRIAAAASIC